MNWGRTSFVAVVHTESRSNQPLFRLADQYAAASNPGNVVLVDELVFLVNAVVVLLEREYVVEL